MTATPPSSSPPGGQGGGASSGHKLAEAPPLPMAGSPPLLGLIVGVAGAATMVVELGAVRLLAPWFGTSSSVWTNVIGVVLAALALGYALGARLANGREPLRMLGLVLLLGAGFAAWLPLMASGLASWFMPEGVALHEAADLLVWGSLGAAAVLFLPAATTLGCAGPLAVEVLQRMRGGAAGRAGGHILAASTLGSLGGTFGTTHLFIPSLGVTGTFLLAAAALGLCGGLLLWLSREAGRARVLAPLALLAVGALGAAASNGRADSRPPGEGETLLAAADSAMQSLRVIETDDEYGVTRYLRVNESLDSFQSIWVPEPGLLTGGRYYDHFALPYAWQAREGGEPPAEWRMLTIGLGAGTAVRVLDGVVDPVTEFTSVGVEIDPVVVELGKRYFDLEHDGEQRVAVGGMDGRAALRYVDGPFDQIVVDAYANNMEIPAHLASFEAFAAMGEVLKPGGWVTVNVGGFGFDDPVVEAVAAAAAVGLDTPVSLARVPFSRNLTLYLRPGAEVPSPGTTEFGSRGQPLMGETASLVPNLTAPGAFDVRAPADLAPLAQSDDRSNMEELQLQSIRLAAARLEALDDASRDGEAAAGAGEPSADDRAASDAAFRHAGEVTLALQAASEIEDPGLRAYTEAGVLWGAGDLFGALQAASTGLRADPEDTALLYRAIDLGLTVGARRSSSERLERLRGLVAKLPVEAQGGWAEPIQRLEGYQVDAQRVFEAKELALGRARWAVWLMGAAALGLILVLSRKSTPAAPMGAG